MTSTLKSETARLNGAKSKGPKTPQGKARSSQNAVTHGLTADYNVLPTESLDDFEILLHAYVDRFHPSDAVEMELVQTMAIARWRLRRVGTIESCMLENEIERTRVHLAQLCEHLDEDNRLAMAFRNLANDDKALALLMRYESSLNRTYDRALKQLAALQSQEVQEVQNEPTTPVTRQPAPTSQPFPEVHEHSLRSPSPAPDPSGPYYEKAA
jgi:hypothetical protein